MLGVSKSNLNLTNQYGILNFNAAIASFTLKGFQSSHQASRYIKIYQDISRYIKIYPDISRYIQIYPDMAKLGEGTSDGIWEYTQVGYLGSHLPKKGLIKSRFC